MSFVKLSEETIVNLNQVLYCKMSRIPVQGKLVPNALLQVFFAGDNQQHPVQFEGEEAERLWQVMEYKCVDHPSYPMDED